MSDRGRATVEVVVLIFATTLALVILFTGVAVVVVELVSPQADTSAVVEYLADTLQVLLGAVLGYIVRGTREARPDVQADTGAMSTQTPDPQPDATEPQPTPVPDPGVTPDEDTDEDTRPAR